MTADVIRAGLTAAWEAVERLPEGSIVMEAGVGLDGVRVHLSDEGPLPALPWALEREEENFSWWSAYDGAAKVFFLKRRPQ